MKALGNEAKAALESVKFKGDAEFIINQEKNTVELYGNDDLCPSDIGRALYAICSNKDSLDSSTTFSINGWNVGGLDESNFGLVDFHTRAYQNYGAIEVAAVEFTDQEKSGAYIDEDTLYLGVGQEGYEIGISGDEVSEYINNNELDYDEMIRLVPHLNDQYKKEIFEDLKTFMKEEVVSSKFGTPSAVVDIDLFDVARLGKDELYNIVEQTFQKEGVEIDISQMDAKPIKINEDGSVSYRFTPTEFTLNNKQDWLFDNNQNDDDCENIQSIKR